MSDRPYLRIVRHYEGCLHAFQDGPRAVDWKSERDAEIRYEAMLDLIPDRTRPATLLDFGCGLAGLKDHIDRRGLSHISYSGLDLSPDFARAARQRHPGVTIYCCDILSSPDPLPSFDYVVMNGIFTRRQDLSIEEMTRYMQLLTEKVFAICRAGLAFNVMSKCVDWESEALYHPSPGELSSFIGRALSKHFTLRNDYGLYECTCYVYRDPNQAPALP